MENKRKKGFVRKPTKTYSEAFKRIVVKEFERGFLNKDQLKRKYNIAGNSCVLNWCRKYGKLPYPIYQQGQHQIGRPMKDPQKQRIKNLEARLKDAELKLKAYEHLISIAEQAEGISILKKDAAKQLKSLHKSTPER